MKEAQSQIFKAALTNNTMKTLQDVLIEAQQLVSDIQSLIDASIPPVEPTATEVDLLLSDGTIKKFVPVQ